MMSKKQDTKAEKIEKDKTKDSTDENTKQNENITDSEKDAGSPDNAESKSEKELSEEEKLSQELQMQKEQYLRLAAEYDNYRKRTQNEKLSIYDDATAKAVTEMLPIADSIIMALSTLKETDVPTEFSKGIELVANQLKKSFEKLNVTEFGEIGDEFDPAFHNAVSKIDDDSLKENSISAVYQKGFKLKDKIVRHAMVQVANCD